MVKIIGVRFRTAGKIYFFDPLDFMIKRGDHVVVETARGIEYGTVVSDIREVENDKVIQPLKAVIRIATEEDEEQERTNKEKEKEAFKVCLEKIRKHGLEMKLIDAEYTFDNNKVLFYFTADGRIDFRELVKDLASVFKTRIELRQIGVRDETKIMGGIGICGRPLCCHSYLSDFVPVSIKMAKEQNLSLNPTKISGVCGRLMCCLKNEEETYEELNRRLPNVGDYVTTEDGLKGEVQSVNVLRQLVKVIVDVEDEKEIHEYEVDKLRFKRKYGKKETMDVSEEEMMELERLEKEDVQEVSKASQDDKNDLRDKKQHYQENKMQNHDKKVDNRDKKQHSQDRRQADRDRRQQSVEFNEGKTEGRHENRPNRRHGGRKDSKMEGNLSTEGQEKRSNKERGFDKKNGGRRENRNQHFERKNEKVGRKSEQNDGQTK